MSIDPKDDERQELNAGDSANRFRFRLWWQRGYAQSLREEADLIDTATERGAVIPFETLDRTDKLILTGWLEEDRRRGRKISLASRSGGLIRSEALRSQNAPRDAMIREAARKRDAAKPGERKPTLKEIGKQFGLSASTISRIVNP